MIDENTIDNLSRLARIEIEPGEKEKLMQDMESVLQYVSELKNAPTEESSQAKEHINIFREDSDAHESGLFTEKILENAPKNKDGYFLVKQIMEEKKR